MHLNEEIQRAQEIQAKQPIDVSQRFNTKSREPQSSLMVELPTKCDCDTLEGIRDPNNTPIRKVSATDAALNC
jgi:hypothetical protein